jgi:hypothetical protein
MESRVDIHELSFCLQRYASARQIRTRTVSSSFSDSFVVKIIRSMVLADPFLCCISAQRLTDDLS